MRQATQFGSCRNLVTQIIYNQLQQCLQTRNQKMENSQSQDKIQEDSFKFKIIQYSIHLTNFKIPLPATFILIVIETLQIISMSTISQLGFSSLGLQYFQYMSNFLYPDYYMKTTNIILYAIPFSFVISCFHLFLFVYTYFNQSRLRIIVYYLYYLYVSILPIPFLLFNSSVYICSATSPYSSWFTCYEGIHILYLSLATFTIVWIIFCTLFVFLFYSWKNPLAGGYFSTSSNYWVLAKLVLKLSPVVFINIDSSLYFKVLYSVSYAGLNLIYFAAFKIMWPYNRKNQIIEKFIIRNEILVISTTGFLIFVNFFADDNKNIVFVTSIFFGLVSGELVIKIFDFRKKIMISMYLPQEGGQKQISVQQYTLFFLDLIMKIESAEDYKEIQLLHIYKLHQAQCQNEQCQCWQIKQALSQQHAMPMSKYKIFKFVNLLIEEALEQNKKNNSDLIIISAYISFYKLGQRVKSIVSIAALLAEDKVSLVQKICIRRLFHQYKQTSNTFTDLNKYSQFSKYLWSFQNLIQKAVTNCCQYWMELFHQDCEISKVWSLANIVSRDKQHINQFFNKKIACLFPTNLYMLRVFCQLLYSIYKCSYKQIEKYIASIDIITGQLQNGIEKEGQLLLRQNDNICILSAVQTENFFSIVRVSNNISSTLGFQKNQILNQNINCIMPEIYRDFHDARVREYINQQDSEIKQRESEVYTIDGFQNIINIKYKAKVVSSLVSGFELVCFIKKINSLQHQNRKYLSYVHIQDQGKEADNFQHSTGDIIIIDKQLRQKLLNCENNQHQICNIKMKQLLPQWNIGTSSFQKQVNNNNKITKRTWQIHFSSIKLVHQDELDNNLHIKWLQFKSIKFQKPKITIDPGEPFEDIVKKKKNEVKNIRDSFWSQISNSRLNLIQNVQQKKLGQALVKLQNLPIQIPRNLIYFLSFCLFIILVSLCVASFKLIPQYLSIVKQDFDNIQDIQKASTSLYEISLVLTKNSVLLSNASIFQMFDQIGANVNSLYYRNGLNKINSQIVITLMVYQQNNNNKQIHLSLNNAISYFTAVSSNLLKNNDIISKINVFNNLYAIYQGCQAVTSISQQIRIQKQKNLIKIGVIYQSFQSIFLIIASVIIVIRVIQVIKFAQEAVQVYKSNIDIAYLQELITKCQKFNDKISGKLNKQLQAQKGIKAVLNKYQQNQQKFIPINSFLGYQNQNAEQMIALKNGISFSGVPTKYKFVATMLVAICLWATVKLMLKLINVEQIKDQRIQNRIDVNSDFQLISQIQRLIFYTQSNDYSSKDLLKTLYDVEKTIKQSIARSQTRTSIDFAKIIQILTQIQNKEIPESQYAQMQSNLRESQNQLRSQGLTDIKNQYNAISNKQSSTYLFIQILVSTLVIMIICKLCLRQQEIYRGSRMMLEMIKQN